MECVWNEVCKDGEDEAYDEIMEVCEKAEVLKEVCEIEVPVRHDEDDVLREV